jgi:hypothetical protein
MRWRWLVPAARLSAPTSGAHLCLLQPTDDSLPGGRDKISVIKHKKFQCTENIAPFFPGNVAPFL